MAAPANNKCEKCGGEVPIGAQVCPECGAPAVGGLAEAEAAVYPELARANLARMRGDYKQSEDVLLGVLRQYPNNPSANEMLGDLAAEREDWPHAMNWYELALEIVPDSASIARKHRNAGEKVAKQQTQDTTAQLGLPDPSSRVPLLITAALILLVAVAAGAYYLGTQGAIVTKPRPTVQLQAQPDESKPIEPSANKPQTPPAATEPDTEDAQILRNIQSKIPDSGVIAVGHDPRSNALTVTFSLTNPSYATQAAALAGSIFEAAPGYASLTLRGINGGKIAFVADVLRTAYAESQAPDWKTQHPDPDALEKFLLQNIWPPQGPPEIPPGPPNEGAGG